MKLINHKNEELEFSYNANNIHILDSYKVSTEDMDEWLILIREAIKEEFTYKRSNNSWKNEWKAHNFLFKHNIQKGRTKDVDLNEDEPLLKRFIYSLLSFIA